MKKSIKILAALSAGLLLANEKAAVAQDSVLLNYTGTIVRWTVPACVDSITITAIGATGGQFIGFTPPGGSGAKMSGKFAVSHGQVLKILVGGAGQDGSGGGGGGGGTFVTDTNNVPYIVAGGGGGASADNNSFVNIGIDAVTGTTGVDGNSALGNNPSNYGVGGVNGNGATNSGPSNGPCGGNGGGLLTDGLPFNCCSLTTFGLAFVNGGTGGVDNGCYNDGAGGFGGGGSGASTGGGGGGGYSGGGGSWDNPTNGGGAGSYNNGANQFNLAAFNSLGNGQVLITYSVDSITSVNGNTAPDNGGCTGKASVTIVGGSSPFTYSWTGGATSDTITNKCAGGYCCLVTDSRGCKDSTCVNIPLILGMQNITTSGSISFYPDPNNGQFTVSGVEKGQVIELYNYMGQKLSTVIADKAKAVQFDISDKAAGIYIVRIKNNNGTLVTEKKIVKQ